MSESDTANQPVPLRPFVSYSINHEDVFLNRLFGEQAHGFYVDVGAAHPTYENDTRALYDRGWHGINIEPNQEFFSELAAARPRDRNLNLAVSNEPGCETFYQVVGTGLSTCDPEESRQAAARGFQVVEHRVKADSLRNILNEANPPTIDLLKVDVEGFELQVLRSNDWFRFRPILIIAEVTYPGSPARRPDVIKPFLAEKGYRRVYFDGLNDYYIENNFDLPSNVFDRPPNVFDCIVRYADQKLARERDDAIISAQNRNAALAEQNTALAEQNTALAEQNTALAEQNTALAEKLEYLYVKMHWWFQLKRVVRAILYPRQTLRYLLNRRANTE